MNIFSLFLKAAFDWGVGKLLDVAVKCFSCGEEFEQKIGNVQSNNYYCSNCHQGGSQFTNACKFTINPRTNSIGQALIIPGGHKWTWEGGGLFSGANRLSIPHYIRLKDLQGRDLLVYTSIRTYTSDEYVTSHKSLISPPYLDSSYSNYSHLFGKGIFDSIDERFFTVDSTILSEYKDIICTDRRVIKPFKD